MVLGQAGGPEEIDDDLVVTEQRGCALVDMAHPRFSCTKYPFSSGSRELFCDHCFCWVCDCKACDCEEWDVHQNATDQGPTASTWKVTARCAPDLLTCAAPDAAIAQAEESAEETSSSRSTQLHAKLFDGPI